MQTQTLQIDAPDGHHIHTYWWAPARREDVRAVVFISHGMAEHGARYRWLAEQLTQAGFAVFAHDHRGHGRSIAQGVEGLYADEGGWGKVVNDLGVLQAEIRRHYPVEPLFLFAHSMGSFIAQTYVSRQGDAHDLCGLVLSGSSLEPAIRLRAMKPLIMVEKKRVGPKGTSAVLHAMTFGNFSRLIHEKRTEFDWLSRDSRQVDAYVADPWCGFDCKMQLWEDLADGLLALTQPAHYKRFPSELPMYVFAGDHDPVGDMGRGVRRLANAYISHGQYEVNFRIYPGGRHEMINEANRDEVVHHLLQWLEGRLADLEIPVT